jgi:flavin-dependent dehydrogenase
VGGHRFDLAVVGGGAAGRVAAARLSQSATRSVFDASSIPNGPAAFTRIPTMMLTERIWEQITTLL